jgi:hypothetical protein
MGIRPQAIVALYHRVTSQDPAEVGSIMRFSYAKASKLFAIMTAVSLIAHAKVLSALINFLGNGGNMMAFLLGLGGVLYPVFGVLSVAGMWSLRSWGFFSFYAHLVLATLLLGVSYVPFLPAALPFAVRAWAVMAVNLLALFSVAAVHRQIVYHKR